MKGFIRVFRLSEIGNRLSSVSESGQLIYWNLLERADWRLGRVEVTHEDLARLSGKSVRTIERSTKELVNAGLVKHKKGFFAINPEFAWGGRSWNINNASYYTMDKRSARIINFVDASEALHRSTHSHQTPGNVDPELVRQRKGG